MKQTISRLIRRVVPSTAMVSHNPFFKLAVNTMDIAPRLVWKEYRGLPPNHLRIRIGMGNRFFTNQTKFLLGAESFWLHYMGAGAVKFDSTIVDIGCGCGRYGYHMRDFEDKDTRFTGKYIGVDIDPDMVQWCQKNFDAERFEFVHSTHGSKSYKQTGAGDTKYVLPIADGTVDFVFSISVFTHLLEREAKNYIEESLRILKPGGWMVQQFFCLDYPPPTYGGRHTFQHRIGNATVESLKVPEASVAYSEAFMLNLAREVGFTSAEVVGKKPPVLQSALIARK
jgi:SAM-dependent methyltransferase